jgi:hypothetical protein
MKTLFVRLTFAAALMSLSLASASFADPQAQLTLKKPDLTIKKVRTSIVLPCPPSGVPSLRFIAEVDNVGKLDVNPGPANKTVVVHGPTHTVKADLPYVAAGGTALVQLIYNPQTGEPSAYPDVAFTFTVNGNHSIIESNYSNNTYTTTVALPPGICNALKGGPPAPAPPSH